MMNAILQIVFMLAASTMFINPRTTLHVSPHGDDDAEGTLQHPLATPYGARDRIRQLRTDEEFPGQQIEVLLHEGEYRFPATLVLTANDSGSRDAPIVYAAAPGESVRFVGGCTLPDDRWKVVEDDQVISRLANQEAAQHIRQFDLHAVGISTSDTIHPRGFPQPIRPAPMELFFDGRPMTLARYPNDGFVHTGNVIDTGSVAGDVGTPERLPVFQFDDERLSRWVEADDVWLFGYWKWDWADEAIRVAKIDPDTHQITLTAPHRYGLHAGKPFYAENLLQELDQPGEYYIDREAGMLYFWPPTAIESAECCLSTLAEPMIRFDNASHIQFEGITIEYSRGDAIRISDGTDVIIASSALRNLGNRAVVVEGGSDHIIENCDIELTGEGGITLSGGDRHSLTPCNHRVSDCRIRDFSRRVATYRPAVRLAGVGCRVDHCEMSDAPHAAILFGGNDHLIEYNDIHHVLTRTGDGGAVYCGRDWTIRGTIIRRNHFHDLVGISKWENAVYIDDQASGITISENLFTDCHWGMLMGGGRDNVIEGNVFVDCGLALHFDARGLGWAGRMLGTLQERLEAVPYRDEPWAGRFPQLLTILDDEPMVPKGNVIRGNLLIRSGRIDQDMASEVKTHGNVEGNQSGDHEPSDEDPADAILRSLPLDDIGPRRDSAEPPKKPAPAT